MNMKTTSYYKLYRFLLMVVALVLMFIGLIIVTVSMAVYRNTKLAELSNQGDLFVECIDMEYQKTGNLSSMSVYELHRAFSKEYNLDIYIYSREGNCLLSPENYNVNEHDGEIEINYENIESDPLPEKTIDKLEDGKLMEYDKTSFSSSEPQLCYGRRIFLGSSNGGKPTKMYAVIYGKTRAINRFTFKIALFYFAFAAIGYYVVYMLIKRRMKKCADYERSFHKITGMYARGDFSERLSSDYEGMAKEIADYVNSLAASVEKSEETSKTFIANVSHELRTPITTVGGFVDGILDGTIPKSRQNEYLVLVSKEIHRLKILISSMLNMTRFESGTLSPNFKTTNLTELVIQTVLMFEKKIESKNIEIEGLDCGKLTAVVDADLIQQVIYNLVENAVKFVNTGGTISFRFDKTPEWFEIGIKNTGEGLKNNEIQQVFDRFYKTDSSRGKDTSGLGLGLSISRKIVHLHNGHIVVKSVCDEYTEFIIQLPLSGKNKERNNNGR